MTHPENKEKQRMIEIKSLRERILLKDLLDQSDLITDLVYTKYNGNDKYDAKWVRWHQSGRKAGSRVICETKVRQYEMGIRGNQPPYESWFIEKQKYDFLISEPLFDEAFYVCIHPDGYQLFSLKQCTEPIWREEELPIHDQTDDCKTKWVGDLLTSESQKVYQKINIFEALDRAGEIWESRQINK